MEQNFKQGEYAMKSDGASSVSCILVDMEHFAGSQFSLFLGGAVAHSAVFSRMLHCKISSFTDKAVALVPLDGGGNSSKCVLWLPRKAITKKKLSNGMLPEWYSLAHWFQFNPAQWDIIERLEHIGGQGV